MNNKVMLMLKRPESMDECAYFTRRDLGDEGHVQAGERSLQA